MKTPGLSISVAGIRGWYPDVLTPLCAYEYALAFAAWCPEKHIFVGRDTRASGEVMRRIVTAGLLAAGKDVFDLGICPTPLVEFGIERGPASAGVMVTASHNPLPYNGIKFLSSKGTFLNEREGRAFFARYDRKEFAVAREPGTWRTDDRLLERFYAAIRTAVGTDMKRRHFTVVVDACNGVGALSAGEFLRTLGCRVIVINDRPLGRFSRNPEPLPEHLGALCRTVKKEGADIGFAQDPDGDRLAVVSEQGVPIGEEKTLVFAAEAVLRRHRGPVVANLSTTSLLDVVAKRFRVPVRRTKVGEVHVVEGMKRARAVIGGEGNGGVIWPDVHYGRDSYVGMALILSYLLERRTTVSKLADEYPPYRMLKMKYSCGPKEYAVLEREARRRFRGGRSDERDGLKILTGDGWIHIRRSGTEPVVRVIVEGTTPEKAQAFAKEIGNVIETSQ